MQRGRSRPARRQGSSCSPEGQAGKNLLQLLLVSTAGPRPALPRSRDARQTGQLQEPRAFPKPHPGSGEQPLPAVQAGQGLCPGHGHRAQSRAANALTPKARPHLWPAAPDMQPAPDKHLERDCAVRGAWLWCNRACPCPGRQLWVQRARQNVPRLPKLLLSPSTSRDPAHTSGHRHHRSLFSSFIEQCWRTGLCRGQGLLCVDVLWVRGWAGGGLGRWHWLEKLYQFQLCPS